MSILDDPAMRPHAAQPQPRATAPATRVRFRPDSGFAQRFILPPGTCGVILDRWCYQGTAKLNMTIEGAPGTGYASGVPESEVEEA